MVKRSLFKAFLTGVVLVLMLIGPAWAVDPVDPLQPIPENAREGVRAGAVDESIPPAPEKPPAALPEIVIQEETDQPLQDSAVTFQLNDVKFEETLIFSPEELKQLVSGWIGKTIAVGELQKLTGAVTKFYREKGYFLTRAYLPPQTIKEGVVAIAVREGRLGNIIIKGNKRYSRDLIRNTLKIIRGEGAIRTDDVERALLLLMDNPGLTVKVTFKPGDRPGTSDIVLEAAEAFPLSVQFDYDNFGNKFVAEHRGGLTMTANNPFGIGDSLILRAVMGMTADSMSYGRAEYALPLGYSGLRLGFFYSHMQYNIGRDLAVLDAGGESDGVGIWLSYPIIRGRTLNWFVNGGFEAKDITQTLFSKTIGEDKVRHAYLGTSFRWLDTIGGFNAISLKGYQGFSHLLKGMDQTYTDTIRPGIFRCS
jgi:hemolysin activation/secretion protein